MGGRLKQRRRNRIDHHIDFSEHLRIPEAQHAIAVRAQIPVAPLVADQRAIVRVLPAVELDDKPMAVAAEVDDERPDRNLPAEMRALERQLSTQVPPQLFLRIGRVAPKMGREPARAR